MTALACCGAGRPRPRSSTPTHRPPCQPAYPPACVVTSLPSGSYIFSQTLFALRMGVNSPIMGAIISLFELTVFMLPLNILAFLPNFFFGGLIMWIGYDICKVQRAAGGLPHA